MAELILKKYGEFAGYTDQSVAALRSEMQAADQVIVGALASDKAELENAISATNNIIAENCVKWTDTATTTKAGIVKIGANLTITAGTLSVPVATSSQLGVTRPGTNMSVVNGVLTFTLGGYRGAVDIGLADGSAVITLNAGVVDMIATQKVRAKVSTGCQSELNVKSNGLSYLATRSGTGYSLISIDVGTSYDGVNIGNAAFSLNMKGSNV